MQQSRKVLIVCSTVGKVPDFQNKNNIYWWHWQTGLCPRYYHGYFRNNSWTDYNVTRLWLKYQRWTTEKLVVLTKRCFAKTAKRLLGHKNSLIDLRNVFFDGSSAIIFIPFKDVYRCRASKCRGFYVFKNIFWPIGCGLYSRAASNQK